MATKINPLDFGYIKSVDVTTNVGEHMSVTLVIEMFPKNVEEIEIIQDAMVDLIEGRSSYGKEI